MAMGLVPNKFPNQSLRVFPSRPPAARQGGRPSRANCIPNWGDPPNKKTHHGQTEKGSPHTWTPTGNLWPMGKKTGGLLSTCITLPGTSRNRPGFPCKAGGKGAVVVFLFGWFMFRDGTPHPKKRGGGPRVSQIPYFWPRLVGGETRRGRGGKKGGLPPELFCRRDGWGRCNGGGTGAPRLF